MAPELSKTEGSRMRVHFIVFAICTTLAVEKASSQDQKFSPTEVYQKETFRGFTILINPEVLKHQEEAEQMKLELNKQLEAIASVLPAKPLADLRKVRIWVEWEKKKDGAAEFHPSATWLKGHGYNPDKAGCIEISNTRNFVRWSRTVQPWMVLHELSHAYHHLVLGAGHAGIEAAYKQAVDRKLYESVDSVQGGKKKAYALTNAKEYYAELSEAYFGKNDFYPFTYQELKKHDPVGFQLMESTWGKPRSVNQRGR
jgi:hypothetical protein